MESQVLILSRPASGLRRDWRELWRREPRLAGFGALLLLLALLPMALAWGLDGRELRGANVWIKPIKFAVSIAVLAWTTAWFIGHLPAAQRHSPAVRRLGNVLMLLGGLELAYISLQAALGEASHYNSADPLHAALYAAMGLGALALTATQPWLAWLLWRHPDAQRPPALRLAVQLGLVLSFALGAGAGILLGEAPPPPGGLPLLGWQLPGDLRPAHFWGLHSAQVLPLLAVLRPHPAWVLGGTALHLGIFILLLNLGLQPAALR